MSTYILERAALAFGVQTAEIWVLPAERGAI